MPDFSRPDVWHLCEDASNAVHSFLDSFFKDQTNFDELENEELILSLKLTALRVCLDRFKGDYSAIQEKKQARLCVNRRLPLLPAETIARILHLTCSCDKMPNLDYINECDDVETEWFPTIMKTLRPREDIKYLFLSSATLELGPRDYYSWGVCEEEELHHDIVAASPAKLSVDFPIRDLDFEGKYSRFIEVLLQYSDRLKSLSIFCQSINGKNVLKECMPLLTHVKNFRFQFQDLEDLEDLPGDYWSFVTNHTSHLLFASIPSPFLASIFCMHNVNNLTDLHLDLTRHRGADLISMEQHFSALAFLPNLRSLNLKRGWVRNLVISHEELDASQIVLPSLTSLRLEGFPLSISEALLAFFRKCRIQELVLVRDNGMRRDKWLLEVRHFDFRRLGELFPQLTSLESDWHSDMVVTALSEPEDIGVWLFPALRTLCLLDTIVEKSACIAMLHSRHRVKEVAAIWKVTVGSAVEKDIPEADRLLLYELNKLVPCVVVDFYEEAEEDWEDLKYPKYSEVSEDSEDSDVSE